MLLSLALGVCALTPTYSRDIAPIIQQKCQVCHRPGEIAPFPLGTYQQAARRAELIREVVADGSMPPWHADPRHGRFKNDRSLTALQKSALVAWLDADCPEGDRADLPPEIEWPKGWSIPTPDCVISIPEPITIPASGTVPYAFITVDPHFTEDRWVRAVETRPGNPRVVHHMNVRCHPSDATPPPQGARGVLGGMQPGVPPAVFPDGMAKRIPRVQTGV